MIELTEQLVLASSSPQRQALLREAGYAFRVVPPNAREPDAAMFPDPASYAAYTAWLKARDVAARIERGVVLAADTVVALAGHIIGKPADSADARRILTLLAGGAHDVLTGVCLWQRPADWWVGAVDQTRCRMRRLTGAELEAYLATDRWIGKAGAYAIQDPDPYVEIVAGSRSNVVGLPLELVKRLLEQFARDARA